MTTLTNKRIILGISGGIAAYKSADLARRLKQAGAEVRVVMTDAAKEFITPLTMQAVSGNPVHHGLLDPEAEAGMGHIQLARWADLILIAPASANFIARLVHGQANDLLSTLCLASPNMIALAPAMNQQMWQDASTQQNIALLKERRIHLFGPAEGEQACGDVGPGRMLEPLEIAEQASQLFETGALAGKQVLITAGPTQEAIDPVRFISNHSSGKMGFALAEAAAEAGAKVTLIVGPVHLDSPDRVERINVISANEMLAAVNQHIAKQDIFIGTAAVADYRVENPELQKTPRDKDQVSLNLVKNPDIIAHVASQTTRPFCVGFAAQTHDVINLAKQKLAKKKLDMIIANQVGEADRGFHSDNNAVTIIDKENEIELALQSKSQCAREIIKLIAKRI